ncbi:MAG: PorP/SprF family type IX secretion system membrane protein [Breznakibacter sp.]
MKYLHLKITYCFLLGGILLFCPALYSQYEPFYSQYYQNQLVMNPAFTGFRNSLAFDISVRNQWAGLQGAPKSMFLSGHSPLNKSKVSLGGYLQSWQAGPVSYNQFMFSYSYIVRINNQMLLSLGLGAGMASQHVDFSDMVLIDGSDPNFEGKSSGELVPLVGAGGVLFTPLFYVGLAYPHVALGKFSADGAVTPRFAGSFYGMAGVSLPEYYKIKTKFSVMARLTDRRLLLDNTLRFYYTKWIGAGVSFRPGHSAGAMLNIQVNRNIDVTYAYDFALSRTSYMRYPSHELTLSYDVYTLYKRNKYRVFKRKRNVIDGSDLRSIRYF